MKKNMLAKCNCYEGIEEMISEGGPIYDIAFEKCNCYEGIERMISEGGPVFPIIDHEMVALTS